MFSLVWTTEDGQQIWESEDCKLNIRRETTNQEVVWVHTGRIAFAASLEKFSISDLGDSWFLNCDAESASMELLTREEMSSLAIFLELTPQT